MDEENFAIKLFRDGIEQKKKNENKMEWENNISFDVYVCLVPHYPGTSKLVIDKRTHRAALA